MLRAIVMIPVLLWASFLLSACAATEPVLAAKYEFPELQRRDVADGFQAFLEEVFPVDQQSMVIRSRGTYYLLVLTGPNSTIVDCQIGRLQLGTLGASRVLGCGSIGVPVARSYRFESEEQMQEITTKLRSSVDVR